MLMESSFLGGDMGLDTLQAVAAPMEVITTQVMLLIWQLPFLGQMMCFWSSCLVKH